MSFLSADPIMLDSESADQHIKFGTPESRSGSERGILLSVYSEPVPSTPNAWQWIGVDRKMPLVPIFFLVYIDIVA